VRAVREAQAAHLSGLILTASLAGQVIGIAAFVGVYLSAAAQSSAPDWLSRPGRSQPCSH